MTSVCPFWRWRSGPLKLNIYLMDHRFENIERLLFYFYFLPKSSFHNQFSPPSQTSDDALQTLYRTWYNNNHFIRQSARQYWLFFKERPIISTPDQTQRAIHLQTGETGYQFSYYYCHFIVPGTDSLADKNSNSLSSFASNASSLFHSPPQRRTAPLESSICWFSTY